MHKFEGKIVTTTEAGREAIVELATPVAGKRYAVISYGTKGRIDLMNGYGRLRKGVFVSGEGEESVDALRATSVRLVREMA